MGPASFLAIRTLEQAAIENEQAYPEAARKIKEDMYMDDLVTGGESVQEVKQTKQQIQDILANAGFHLRKWNTNKEEVLEPRERRNIDDVDITNKENSQKTLGLAWNPADDVLRYTIKLKRNNEAAVTKRDVSQHF